MLSIFWQELKAIRTKHRPRNHGNKMRYKPVVGRDTSSGPLVDTKVLAHMCVCVCVRGRKWAVNESDIICDYSISHVHMYTVTM